MDTKRNQATPNRPEGDRVLDAPFVKVMIPEIVRQLKTEPAWKKNDRNAITVFKSDNLAIVVVALQQGAVIEDNDVDGFISVQVLHGKIRIEAANQGEQLAAGELAVLHPRVIHSIHAAEESVLLLTNSQR